MEKYTPQKGEFFLPVENGRSFTCTNLGSFKTFKGNTYTREGAVMCMGVFADRVIGIDEREMLRTGKKGKANRNFKRRCIDFIKVERDMYDNLTSQ